MKDKRKITNLGEMELVIAKIITNNFKATLIVSKCLEEAFSLEAKLAIPLAMRPAALECLEVGEEAIVFVLEDFGVDIGEFRILFLEIKKRMLEFITIGFLLAVETF